MVERVRYQAGVVLLGFALTACVKLNAAYALGQDGETDDVSTTDSGPGPGTTDKPATSTVGPGPASATTLTESTTDVSGTADDTSSRPDIPSVETEGDPSEWTDACRAEAPMEPCANTIEAYDALACLIGPFVAAGKASFCGLPNVASATVSFPAGFYVFGTVTPFDGQFLVEGLPGGDLICEPRFSSVVTNVPIVLEVSVFSSFTVLGNFIIRDALALCGVPMDCCAASGLGSVEACGHTGLRACVVEADALCEGAWTTSCIEAAVLACGADCAQILPDP